jgi:hypothetical protein
MHIAQGGIVERHAGQELGIGHLFTRFQVFAVFHCGAQVLGDQRYRLERAGIGDGRGGGGNIGLDGVGEGIHAGGGSQALGLAIIRSGSLTDRMG